MSLSTKEELVNPVKNELRKVEIELKNYSNSAYPLINEINLYLHESRGKRIRPAVLFLVSKLCGVGGDEVVKLGTVVELLHVATLVHDDIIDKAYLRRGQVSVNSQWGSEVSVLMGDWMYMTAFQIALELRSLRILDVLIELTRTMVAGEMMQLDLDRKIEISVRDQIDICQRKTAHLFSACASLPVIFSGAPLEVQENLTEYGKSLGMVFQITDDMLDYTADQKGVGKPVMKDLEEGKITLPIIFLLEKANQSERDLISEILLEGEISSKKKSEIISLVKRYRTLEQTREIANEYVSRAVQALSMFPDSPARSSLIALPNYILNRIQ